jgi:hypothetical protein
MSEYRVAHLDAIDEVSDGRSPWRPVRAHFGIQSFGINAWTAANAGDRIINEHDEDDDNDPQEELYLVQRGRARFELDGETVDAPAGTFVFAPPAVKRTAFAEEPGTVVLAIGGAPGKPYEVSGWELWAPIAGLYHEQRYAEAAEAGRALLAEHPDLSTLRYNVACYEALAGQTSEAIEHLRGAIEEQERFRKLAADDSDFDSLRDDPAFNELIG